MKWSSTMRRIHDEAEVLQRWVKAEEVNKANDYDNEIANGYGSSGDDSSDADSSEDRDYDNACKPSTDSRLFDHVANRPIDLWVQRGNNAWENVYHFMDKHWGTHDDDDEEASLDLPQCELICLYSVYTTGYC